MKFDIISEVKNGNLTRNRSQIKEAIEYFEGKIVVVTVEKRKNKRSNPQNAYMWGICIPIVKECLKKAGITLSLNDTHEMLKLKFLKETILTNEETGECIERIKSTAELTTTQFMEYILDIQQFASEYFGVLIPDPNSEIKLKFY